MRRRLPRLEHPGSSQRSPPAALDRLERACVKSRGRRRRGHAILENVPEGHAEHLPDCDEQRRQARPQDEARDTEQHQAAQRRKENQQIVHVRVAPDQPRPQDVVGAADNERTVERHGSTLPDRALAHELDDRRDPHHRGADAGEDGKHHHYGRPEDRAVDAGRLERKAPLHALNAADHYGPLEGRPRHRPEPRDNPLFIRRRKGNILQQRGQQLRFILQKK